jgi:hypothetical protein
MITIMIIRRNGAASSLLRDRQWLKELQQLRARNIGARTLIEQMLPDTLPRDADSILVTAESYGLFIAL